ncbi:MAG: hypothetical protein DHS20C18_36550 [Saprospiraceae bacterium]|nr:MAG: hypothetical protein DHS20C18_36550 [Saprospiraceae bacterium]
MLTRFKSKYLFLILLCLPCFTAISQSLDVELGPELKLSKGFFFQDHLYSDDSGHYIYLYHKVPVFGYYETTMILEKYSPSFEKIYSQEYKTDAKGVETHGVKYVKGNFAFLLSEKNRKEDYMKYMVRPIDFEGKAGKQVTVAKFQYDGKKDIPETYWELSNDTTQLAFAAISDQGKKEKAEIFLSVVDLNFEKVWDGKFNFPFVENQFTFNSMVLGNDGSVYILAKVYEDENAKESKKGGSKGRVAAYNMSIFHFTKDAKSPKVYQLELGGEYISGAGIKLSNNKEIICSGIYSNAKNGPVVGTFLTKLSAIDGKVLVSNKKAMGKEEIEMLSDRNVDKKKGDTGLDTDFTFQDVVLKDNGSISITAEEQYKKTKFNTASTRNPMYTVYYNLDILSMNIDKNGELERVAVIPKKQISTDPLYCSFVTLQNEDEVYFFYNDDKDNLRRPLTAKPKKITNYKDCVAVVTIQDKNGKLSRKKLFGQKDTDALFVPGYSKQISKNELFFVAQRYRLFAKTDFQLGIVRIKE